MLRTPLLPHAEFVEWGKGLEAPGAVGDEARLARAIARDTGKLRARLRERIQRDEVRDALFVASPDLDRSLAHWLERPDGARGCKVERALVRYFSRMTGRCTPFGLFSGVSPGTVAERTRLQVAPRADYERHTRLDNDYLFAVTDSLGKTAGIRETLVLRPNSSLYSAAGRLRYAEARLRGRSRSHHLVAVEPTDYLLATLERARDGARRTELAQALSRDHPDIEIAEAEAFIDELVEGQILVHELQPAVTGCEPIRAVLAVLDDSGAAPEARACLADAQRAVEAIDAHGLGAEPDRYQSVARLLRALPAEVHLSRLFQVDMIKPAPEATLGDAVLREVERGIELLARMNERRPDGAIDEFRQRFRDRYGLREVPLVEALDEEAGIGFQAPGAASAEASPLLADLALPEAPRTRMLPWGSREALLLSRVQDVVARGERELRLSRRDVERLSAPDPAPLPDAFSVMPTVVACSQEDLDRGHFQVVMSGVLGPSGARLSGRFCHASPALEAEVRDHLRAEEALRPDAAFAEIVHLPEGRIGNILCRPVLRDWEIPYLGVSGAPRDRQIPIQDLLVTVTDSRVVLRSRRLGREVIPRLSTAHNFGGRGHGLYRFLCSLQTQTASVFWDWGPLEDAPFLPRLTCGKLVFARARWLLSRGDLDPLEEAMRGSKKAITAGALAEVRARVFAVVQEVRARRGLPRHVLLADGDRKLPVDLDNVLSVDSLARLVKSKPAVVLSEVYPGPGELVAEGPEGRFAHELVVAFVRRIEDANQGRRVRRARTSSRPTLHRAERDEPAVIRRFGLGSNWLYAKLYCGTATADDVLREVVAPLARGAGIPWFFIRYGDPDWHLRVRFRGEPNRLREDLLPDLERLTAPALADGKIWRVQLDTYEREIERYGGADGIELAEELFWADSDAVLDIVDLLSGDEAADDRWRLVVRGADLILSDLGFDLEARLRVMARARRYFGAEFHVDAALGRELGARFRAERDALDRLLDPDPDVCADHPLEPGFAALSRRSERQRAIAARLRQSALDPPLERVAWSYIHMHANRLLRSAARAQELVIYDLLKRYYERRLARAPR